MITNSTQRISVNLHLCGGLRVIYERAPAADSRGETRHASRLTHRAPEPPPEPPAEAGAGR